jgi:hypothetical protein
MEHYHWLDRDLQEQCYFYWWLLKTVGHHCKRCFFPNQVDRLQTTKMSDKNIIYTSGYLTKRHHPPDNQGIAPFKYGGQGLHNSGWKRRNFRLQPETNRGNCGKTSKGPKESRGPCGCRVCPLQFGQGNQCTPCYAFND